LTVAFVKACKTSDVPSGGLKQVKVGGKDLVIADVDGKYYAIDDWCTHEEGNLSEGDLNKNILTCPEHGAQFDVTTGHVVLGPDGDSPDAIKPERSYKVTVQASELMVDVP